MLFSSIPFLYYFLPLMLLVYWLAPAKFKNLALLLGSLFFYAWGEKKLVIMLLGTILLGYVSGLLIAKTREKRIGFWLTFFSVSCNLGLLFYFKYIDFFISGINKLIFGRMHSPISLLHVALPIGISFYTFQVLSYIVDVYRGNCKVQKNIIHFAMYVTMFPQLIAGPIVRYADIEDQLSATNRIQKCSLERISYGVKRFICGLSKKVLLANAYGELCSAFRAGNQDSVLFHWLYAVGFMLQIYYDFSGYSDMAIGLGHMLGFTFPENFHYPYCSRSITEFWRRWHITLGTWFRDYVYIPLGGNRKGRLRQLFHISIVWMLTGLWHGASVNFMLWGLFYALLLTIEKLGLLKWLEKHTITGHIYTILTVLFGFVLFQAGSLAECVGDIKGMFGIGPIPVWSMEAIYYAKSYAVILLLGMLGATDILKRLYHKWKSYLVWIEPIGLTFLLLMVTAYLVDGSFNPFLYFRF